MLLFASAAAQIPQAPPSPIAVLRGVLIERDDRVESGEFAVRVAGNEVFRFRFDAKTRIERGGLAITIAAAIEQLRPGERVEVASDAIPDSPLRYARTILAPDPLPPARIPAHARTRAVTAPLESLFPRGDLTFSGVVSYLADGRFVLHTRNSGEQIILLRQDTRYLAEGNIVAGADLKANMRVFVRAGKDIFGHTEAYQVMWGGFLQPH